MTKARKKVRTAKRAGPRRRESVAVRRKRAAAIGKALHKLYPGADCALQHRSALNLLVSTILSAQCTDDRVNKVTPSVFKRYKTAKDFARANPADLEDLIRSTGFFRNKTKNIIGAGRVLTERFGGRVPDTMEDLIELPGVSRKTANVLLGTWFKKNEGFVVDTHVGRLAHRLGLTWRSRDDKDAVKIERDLMDVFSQKEWTFLGHALIWHGRKVCPARKPDCQRCTLARWCPSAFSFEAPPQSKSEARTERGRVAPLARARIESSRTTPKPRRSRGSQRRAGAGRVT